MDSLEEQNESALLSLLLSKIAKKWKITSSISIDSLVEQNESTHIHKKIRKITSCHVIDSLVEQN